MSNIGFLYNCSLNTNPAVRLSPSLLNRVALIARTLRESGHGLFFYSPKHLRPDSDTVRGYRFEAGCFVPDTAPVPRVNGNWTYQTRRLLEKGMGYQNFIEWAEDRSVGVYVPLAFSELVGNKFDTYQLVRSYHESLQPHCEPYRRSLRQLEYFMAKGPLVFIKPRAGNKGDRIITLRRVDPGFAVTYYEGGQHERVAATDLKAAERLVHRALRGNGRYLIQQGVESPRYEDSVFDIRVVMVHDGSAWTFLHEARLSARGKDLSNVSQGGRSVETDDLLADLFGTEASHWMLEDLRSQAYGLATFLDQLHPGAMMEVAFDFLFDSEGKLYLLEINTKPGLVSIGFDKHYHDVTPAEEALFERWVHPHARSLARFLQAKLVEKERARN